MRGQILPPSEVKSLYGSTAKSPVDVSYEAFVMSYLRDADQSPFRLDRDQMPVSVSSRNFDAIDRDDT